MEKDFSLKTHVRGRKNEAFKIKCESALSSTGLSNQQFYKKVGVSRQMWYYYSWSIEPFPHWLKIRLCDMFGKSFRDLFLGEAEK